MQEVEGFLTGQMDFAELKGYQFVVAHHDRI